MMIAQVILPIGNSSLYFHVILTRDKQLWEKITHTDTHCLTDLLPSKRTYQSLRQRGHDYTLPRICTERFKRCFINRSLFNFI